MLCAPHLLNRGSHAKELHAHVLIEGARVSHEKDIFVAFIKSFFCGFIVLFFYSLLVFLERALLSQKSSILR